MATAPVFAATPNLGQGALSAANANRDGTGTVVTCFTAGASGSLVQRLTICAQVTTTAGMIRLFINKGGTIKMIKEIEVDAVTVAATTPAWTDQLVFDPPLVLSANALLVGATEKAEAFAVTVEGADA